MIVAWPQAGSAGTTEIEKDERRTSKYALGTGEPSGRKARGLCVCMEHVVPGYEGKQGFLHYQRQVENLGGIDRDTIAVECRPWSYDRATGERFGFPPGGCDKWVPLAK